MVSADMIDGMSERRQRIEALDRCGNALALDFVNTVHSRSPEHPNHEYLERYEDLVHWAARVEILREPEARKLLSSSARQSKTASRVVRDAVRLREAIHALFLVLIRGGAIHGAELELLNHWLQRAGKQQGLVHAKSGFARDWVDREALERMLWPVAESAALLLTLGPDDRIRECPVPDGGCGWLFLDSSKNGRRRWCNMKTCGNVVKARRHRARGGPAG